MINIISNALSLLRYNSPKNKYDDRERQIQVVNLFTFLGMFITLTLSIVSYLNNNTQLAFVLLISFFIFYFCRLWQAIIKTSFVPTLVILFSLYGLMIYLVYSGGANNSGPLWIFIVAPVTFFIIGLRNGTYSLISFYLVIVLILFYSGGELLNTTYDFEFKTRLCLSFLTTCFLSAGYEYSRWHSFNDMKLLSQQFKEISTIDPLTGILNRRGLYSKLESNSFGLESTSSILLCDIDDFKQINDKLGHDFGDHVLVELAKSFGELGRIIDLKSRWGGEEFLFLLPNTDLTGARLFSQKLHQLLAKTEFSFGSKTVSITMSIGIAELENKTLLREALSIADTRLYYAKRNGKNQSCWI